MIDRDKYLDLVLYQVYPRSFYDSNGDGIGDLNGLRLKLDYLQELGVNAIWLSPCYKSPNFDNGYDISDYRDIASDFGTLEEWKLLVQDMHSRGMKLLMDLVVNHTSSEHFWFTEAKKSRDNPYHDYYVWADEPLTDWRSIFGGSAWEYNEATKEYYLHSFAIQQPDLNWENPKVRKEACDIVDFWVDLGVDGFRCDVLDFISKDFKEDKMFNGPRLHEYVNQLFGRDKVKHLFTIGECQSDEKSIYNICGKDRDELTTVFQFDHIGIGRKNKYTPRDFSYDELRDTLVKWQYFSAKNELLYMLFTDNHDQPYYLSRVGNDKELRYESATALATAFYMLKGIPLIYQGQEFGSVNSFFNDIHCFNDIETVNYFNERVYNEPLDLLINEINYGSRDNTRRPLAWTNDESSSFGFTSSKPWLQMSTRASEVNLQNDLASKKSIFKFYKKLLQLRKNSLAIRRGEFKDHTNAQTDCFVFERSIDNESIFVICNFKEQKHVKLPKCLNENDYSLVLSNYTDGITILNEFKPFEVRIYKNK